MTISDVKTLNKKAGHHFFDPAAMKFFDSKIESSLMSGNYFITSEKPPYTPRHYAVRQYNPSTHTILTISGHMSRKTAKQSIKSLQQGVRS